MVFSSYKIQRVVEFVDESSQPDHSVKTLQHLSDLVEANFIGLAACSGGGGGLHHFVNKKQKNFSEKKKDLGMACHTPPLKKVKKQGEMPLPSLSPIPLKKCRI